MPEPHPPTLDPVAAGHWDRVAPARSPWLHEEVARRMEDRLQWIKLAPAAWGNWAPLRGGLDGHALVERRYPAAEVFVYEPHPSRQALARTRLSRPWWRRWTAPALRHGTFPDGALQMLWANMVLHVTPRPLELIAHWHKALASEGFLMFSCLGPDSLRELRALYGTLGWPAPAHEFTDMHDWGDMLVQSGFAEPVMDMERITLTWGTPAALVAELRELGANLHPGRFPALRGRTWRRRLDEHLARSLVDADGRLALTFEIIYGHAVKPRPRVRLSEQSAVSLDDMRALLHADRTARR